MARVGEGQQARKVGAGDSGHIESVGSKGFQETTLTAVSPLGPEHKTKQKNPVR